MDRAERVTEVKTAPGSGSDRLRGLASQIRPPTLARERSLPLVPALATLVPGDGLRRGSTVVVMAAASGGNSSPQGATSVALALGVAASAAGSWCAAVGMPDLGMVAATELGMAIDRVALVPRVEPGQWVIVVGALLDTVDVVMVRPPPHLRAGDARRLTTRARERGSVLIPVLARPSPTGGPWSDGVEVRLTVTGGRWEGPGTGDGRLLGRRLEVTGCGRGVANRTRQVVLWLPAPDGGIDVVAGSAPGRSPDSDGAYAGADVDRVPDPVADAPLVPVRTAG